MTSRSALVWSRERRCPTGFARIVRDGDWVIRAVGGSLDDETHARMLLDIVAELRRSERSSERALVLVDLLAAHEPTGHDRLRHEKFHEEHGSLLREHIAAIAFLTLRPLAVEPPPCRWRTFPEKAAAILWLEEQARTNGMRGLPRRLRIALSPAEPTPSVR